MKKLYAIGEMAKMHNVPIRTLRYYDAIGLFKPASVDEGSGYRYYSVEQFEHLNTIKYLKFLGFSLKEIDEHLAARDMQGFLRLLKKQHGATAAMLEKLQAIAAQVTNRINELEDCASFSMLEQPLLKTLPRRLISISTQPVSSEAQWEVALSKLERLCGGHPSLFIGKVGFIVTQDRLREKRFDGYDAVFIFRDELSPNEAAATCLAEGVYLCMRFRDGHGAAPVCYEKMLCEIERCGYVVNGDAVERILIDEYITKDEKMQLSEIQIPVKTDIDSPVTE
ncbi:MerR family transcriptional regulator [Azotosporobacter soli]|uniref:MerR family transcriptional regulator n=1 Tax=Azotosporobacter soli TaxID=3055040 RepID=UPI0031FE468B